MAIVTTNRLGEIHLNFQGCKMEIIRYKNCKECDIVFDNGYIVRDREYSDIVKGAIKNLYYPEVLGVGYVGVGNFVTKINKKHTRQYLCWRSMLQRSYDLKYQEKQPTYKGCTVDERWHNFQNFGDWFEENYREGFHLDKDILVKGNKIYSPETCAFVPQEINTLFSESKKSEIVKSVGVGKRGVKFIVRISIYGVRTSFGAFNTEEEAFQVYKLEKEKYIKNVAEKWRGQIIEEVYKTMINYKVEITK